MKKIERISVQDQIKRLKLFVFIENQIYATLEPFRYLALKTEFYM